MIATGINSTSMSLFLRSLLAVLPGTTGIFGCGAVVCVSVPAPQETQNFAPSEILVPQFLQNMGVNSISRRS
jgi:hypothetical protein